MILMFSSLSKLQRHFSFPHNKYRYTQADTVESIAEGNRNMEGVNIKSKCLCQSLRQNTSTAMKQWLGNITFVFLNGPSRALSRRENLYKVIRFGRV